NDAETAAALFADDARFGANGAPHAERRADAQGSVRGLRGDWLPRALPSHRSAARRGALARQIPGEERPRGRDRILDLIEVRDGRIASLTPFFDTPYAANLAAPA